MKIAIKFLEHTAVHKEDSSKCNHNREGHEILYKTVEEIAKSMLAVRSTSLPQNEKRLMVMPCEEESLKVII